MQLELKVVTPENNGIVGREYEQNLIWEYYNTPKVELVAIYGRRRVGKTFLIRQCLGEKIDFYFTGSFETPRSVQLMLFKTELQRCSGQKRLKPKNWFEAFEQLREYLSSLNQEKKVVFLDELPWMDTPKSSFLQAFSYFWNSWASTVAGLKIYVCGSATTWMLSNLIGDRGGLHGRVSRSIYLSPFSLGETESFLQRKGIEWNRCQISEAYMIMGGVAYYLDMLQSDLTFGENIDNLFFREGAPLRTEYDFIFRSLFKDASLYGKVVETLSKKAVGMTRQNIIEELGIEDNGLISEVLDNLCKCDFIRQYSSIGKKSRDCMYQLVDLFSLFHLHFVADSNGQDEHFWSNVSESQMRKSWQGHAFEQVCLHHIPQIKAKLGISGVLSNVYSWSSKAFADSDGTQWKGTQIDLLIDRHDETINICEMKFSVAPYTIDADYDERLRSRTEAFRRLTGTRKALHRTMITTYGIVKNKYSGNVNQIVTINDLFG